MVMYLFWYFMIGIFVASIAAVVEHIECPWTTVSLAGVFVGAVLWPLLVVVAFIRLFQ